jgi:hypothetical protein
LRGKEASFHAEIAKFFRRDRKAKALRVLSGKKHPFTQRSLSFFAEIAKGKPCGLYLSAENLRVSAGEIFSFPQSPKDFFGAIMPDF